MIARRWWRLISVDGVRWGGDGSELMWAALYGSAIWPASCVSQAEIGAGMGTRLIGRRAAGRQAWLIEGRLSDSGSMSARQSPNSYWYAVEKRQMTVVALPRLDDLPSRSTRRPSASEIADKPAEPPSVINRPRRLT